MAFSRLFGKGKKDPPSPSGSNNSPDLSERDTEDNFTLVENKPTTIALANTLENISRLPYPLPNQNHHYPALPPGGGGGGYPPLPTGGGVGATTNSQQSSSSNHPLDGVQFQLSPRLATDSQLDQIVISVENVMSRVKNVDWASMDYNFNLERSILTSELDLDGVKIN